MEPSHERFHHPFQPYSIQIQFMTNLYRCIEEGKVGIFESPTGTGKSLSLICAALTWLRDHKRQSWSTAEDSADDSDWLAQAEKAARRRELLLEIEQVEEKLAAIRENEARAARETAAQRRVKKPRIGKSLPEHVENDEEFLLEDYASDNDGADSSHVPETNLSTSTQALLDRLRKPVKSESAESEDDQLKLIICSRTHSQLTQFVNELRRVKPPSSFPAGFGDGARVDETLKHLALGSRKNTCINEKVAQLSSTLAINDRCLELQKPATPKESRCRYLPTKDETEKVRAFRDRAIAQIRDIEDIGRLGRSMSICPYYASRSAIATSEVLTLPYPLLLQQSAREALGVSIKGNVVIIDEAHNLMDAIADTFSVSIRLTQMDQAVQQVTFYANRFKNKLKGKNRVYIAQVLRLLNSLAQCLRDTMDQTRRQSVVVTAARLMSGKGVDQINPHKLLCYLYESRLAHKVEGYAEAQNTAGTDNQTRGVMMQFQNFLSVLMNPSEEGRFFVSRAENDIVVKYTLLDPREHFRGIVQEARSVILAGGTMSPMSDYANHLFSYLEPDQLRTFTFGHVIPNTHLFATPVVAGPSNVGFDFTFENRGTDRTIMELGELLVRVCRAVPDGVVVFFPSYDYLSQVTTVWNRLPTSTPISSSLAETKPVFQESKALPVDALLKDFTSAVSTGNGRGALMLAVIGGKLSEGINFSDSLGRAVVCVGLPFPNSKGAEWQAKLSHIESNTYKRLRASNVGEAECNSAARAASREFYENTCMRAVNQAIGRAIRHRNDYAAILLVDRRFASERIMSKLPGWIRAGMARETGGQVPRVGQRWETIEEELRLFFEGKKK